MCQPPNRLCVSTWPECWLSWMISSSVFRGGLFLPSLAPVAADAIVFIASCARIRWAKAIFDTENWLLSRLKVRYLFVRHCGLDPQSTAPTLRSETVHPCQFQVQVYCRTDRSQVSQHSMSAIDQERTFTVRAKSDPTAGHYAEVLAGAPCREEAEGDGQAMQEGIPEEHVLICFNAIQGGC